VALEARLGEFEDEMSVAYTRKKAVLIFIAA